MSLTQLLTPFLIGSLECLHPIPPKNIQTIQNIKKEYPKYPKTTQKIEGYQKYQTNIQVSLTQLLTPFLIGSLECLHPIPKPVSVRFHPFSTNFHPLPLYLLTKF